MTYLTVRVDELQPGDVIAQTNATVRAVTVGSSDGWVAISFESGNTFEHPADRRLGVVRGQEAKP